MAAILDFLRRVQRLINIASQVVTICIAVITITAPLWRAN
jgi:hypothetical protein